MSVYGGLHCIVTMQDAFVTYRTLSTPDLPSMWQSVFTMPGEQSFLQLGVLVGH
jgi:hypothetical protein